VSADGWSRATAAVARAVRATGLQPAELADAQRRHGGRGGRPDSNRYREDHDLECCRYTNSHHEAGTTGLEPAAYRLTSERSPSELRPRNRKPGGWKARSAPRNRRQRRCLVGDTPEPAVAHRRSCQRVSAPAPPHRSAVEACRSQLHVRARALRQPFFCHFLGPPVGGPILMARVGFEPTVSSS
jgi:hypothetical protein